MKLLKNIKQICFNVRRPNEICLVSNPFKGEVFEHEDRYHYWVNHENGLSEMVVHKNETISMEILYFDDAVGKNELSLEDILHGIDVWRIDNEEEMCDDATEAIDKLKNEISKLWKP